MNRIIIIGPTGSGKTRLALKLKEKLGLPFADLDDLYWQPNWVPAPEDDFLNAIKAFTTQEKWIIAGNYSKTHYLTWPLADTLIWIDYPLRTVFRQLVIRSITRMIDKKPICNGNFETLENFLSQRSILLWLFKTYKPHKKRHAAFLKNTEKYPQIKCVRLKSPKETQRFLESL